MRVQSEVPFLWGTDFVEVPFSVDLVQSGSCVHVSGKGLQGARAWHYLLSWLIGI